MGPHRESRGSTPSSTERTRMVASKRARYALIVIGIVLGLGSVEVALRLFFALLLDPHTRALAQAVNVPDIDREVPDARLGYRLNPLFPGYDARGWRNASALKRADVVALGDSQTFGLNVSTEAAWPQRLGDMVHRTVYQMAVPGYGPGQFLLLFDEAAALRPKVIIAAFYMGDAPRAYQLAYHSGISTGAAPFPFKNTAHDPFLDSFVSADPKIRESIQRAETIDPNFLRSNYLDCNVPRPIPDPRLQLVHDILTAPPLPPLVDKTAARESSGRITSNSFVRQSSRLYRLTRNAVSREWHLRESFLLYRVTGNAASRVWHRVVPSSAAPDYGPPFCVHYHDPQMRTVFTPAYRLITLDRTDPRIVEGERISLLAYQALAERSRRAGIRFYVALIPTKETAFRARAEAAYHREPYLRDLWSAEAGARSRALAFCNRHGIGVIDTLPALEAAIVSGVNPYREDYESHPISLGYDAIAHAMAERLQRDGFAALP